MGNIKAQIETIGLLVIVIIVVIIILFVLQFSIYNQDKSDLPGKLLEIKANNLRNSVLKTTLCQNINIEKEILNCYSNDFKCVNSCDELKIRIKDIIENSIEENYEFNVNDLINLKRGTCQEVITSICQPIDFNLKVCVNLCFQ